ncbi:MAG TPA: LuxR C-terminal-related transcriptional regulator [Caulobacter sp.]|nr:LuxR C-terminal-related transcriptional regulator [Caulobacter sp.]
MFDSHEASPTEALLGRLAVGHASRAVLDHWRFLETTCEREPEALAEALRLGVEAMLDDFVSLVPGAAFAVAVVGLDRRCHYADDRFLAWFGDEPVTHAGFRRLTQLALRQGQASGLVDANDGAAIAACAAGAQAAAGWPLPAEALQVLSAGSGRTVLIAFAPSRDPSLALRAARMLGLTPLEARLAEALLDSPTVQLAAERIGVGYETAREALGKIQKRLGVRRTSDVVRKLMTLMCGDIFLEPDLKPVMTRALGATPAEARVGALVAEGLSAGEIAARLGVKEATVRGQLKALYAKAGVSRGRDLVRIVTEAGAMASMTRGVETALQPESLAGMLRVAQAPESRQVAYWDYGPRGSRPVLVMHGAITGRTLPPAFVSAMHARGWRPIVPQRPGFGLTDMASGDYLQACADDMAVVLDALRLDRARVVARDSGAAAALAFAERYPGRLTDGILLRPHAPGGGVRAPGTITGAVKRLFFSQPDLIGLIAETMRRQNRSDLLKEITLRAAAHVAADAAVVAEPMTLTSIIRDIQAISARSIRGFAEEQSLYARGWRIPEALGTAPWQVVEFTEMPLEGLEEAYAGLPGVRFSQFPEAGLYPLYSHPEALAELLAS